MTVKHIVMILAALLATPFALAQTPGAPATAAQHPPAFKTPILKRAQLDALLADPAKIVVIDLRRPDEIQTIGSLPVYLSIQTSDLKKSLAYIPKDRAVITVSNHAARAGKAGDVLTSAGFKVAGAVGVQFYEKEGGTLAKISPPKAQQ
jgi:rhodanese-related sulfurtransferase